jgi:6-phosphofructokinase 1
VRVAISTGGGDAPGLNAVIRACVLAGLSRGWELAGIERGYDGLLGRGAVRPLTRDDVRGIAHLGGTILGTTNRGDPFRYPVSTASGVEERDRSDDVVAALAAHGIDALVAIGGDGGLAIALGLHEKGVPVVGVPKTIDNDVGGTFRSFGFDTAVSIAAEALGRLHSTAEAHERVMVVEVMGRNAGWIALHAGLAGSADVILVPEIPFTLERVLEKVRERDRAGRRFTIVVVAEGAAAAGGEQVFAEAAGPGRLPRLGGVGARLAEAIEAGTGKETRCVVLGHLQRGGGPTTFDCTLALRFGAAAIRAIAAGDYGTMVAYHPPAIATVALERALEEPRRLDLRGDAVATARETGVCLGD